MSEDDKREEMTNGVLIAGPNGWGFGKDEPAAMKRYREVGYGKPADGYAVYAVPPGTVLKSVDAMGRFYFDGPEPMHIRTVKPRKR